MKKVPYIDSVRCLANYMIVLLHAWAAAQYVVRGSTEYEVCRWMCNLMSTFALPALFLISGYLLMRGLDMKLADAGAIWRHKLWNRIKRLVIPYLVWNATFVLFYLMSEGVFTRLGERVQAFELNTFAGAFVKIISFMQPPIDMPLWFMRTLIVYSLLAFPVWMLLRALARVSGKAGKWLELAIVYGCLAVWVWYSKYVEISSRLIYTYPCYSAVCFVIGCHLSVVGRSPFDFFKSKAWLAFPVCSLVLFYLSLGYAWRDLQFLCGLPLLLTFGSAIDRIVTGVRHHGLIVRSSFFLYAGHFLVCSSVMHLTALALTGWQGPGKLVLLICVFVVLGVGIALALYTLGRKFLGRWFGLWDGTL